MAGMAAVGGTRLLFIDNLRTVIIILVIMVHLSITYGGEGSWYYEEGEPDQLSGIVLTLHNGVNQSFFMGCLFLISGYFTPASFDRKGPRQFLRDRLLRLGIPMLIYDLAIHPFIVFWLGRGGVYDLGSFRDWAASYYTSFHLGRGPLWFVEALLLFSLIYLMWRLASGAAERPVTDDAKPPSVSSLVLLAVTLAFASFVVRLQWPVGWAFGPLNFQFPFFPQYIAMFSLGVVAYRRQWLTRIPRTTGRWALALAAVFIVILSPALMILGGGTNGDVSRYMGGFHGQALAMAFWEQSLGVLLTVGLIVQFRERLNRQGPLGRAASANSFAVYVIHAPVIILLALAVRGIHLHPLLKFIMVALIAVPPCFVLAAAIRRLPGVRRVL